MPRAYLRLDPGYFERRLERGDPPGAVGAYVAILCLAESQPKRGRFRDEGILRALLTPRFARWIPYLAEQGDLVLEGRRAIYVEGWDEWQEGDWKVAERIGRIRERKRISGGNGLTPDVTVVAVTHPSSGGGGGKRRLGGGKAGAPYDGPPDPLSALNDL